jgi:hypothetical protein
MTAGGGPANEVLLREALRAARARSADPAFRDLVGDVLAGRRDLREAARTPEFGRAVGTAVRDWASEWDGMPESERRRLAGEAASALGAEPPGG